MKKLAAFLIMTLPLISPAAYVVNYELTDYNIWDWPVSNGYYLMLIDGSYEVKQFKETIPSGENTSADIGNLPYDKILYKGSTKDVTGDFEIGTTSANKAYLAVFTTDDFPGEAYYTLYAYKYINDMTFKDSTVWLGNTYHVKNLTNSIPEPSAGLLLLTGLSVLALKRKRGACVFS